MNLERTGCVGPDMVAVQFHANVNQLQNFRAANSGEF
jgi:hypothetical protein